MLLLCVLFYKGADLMIAGRTDRMLLNNIRSICKDVLIWRRACIHTLWFSESVWVLQCPLYNPLSSNKELFLQNILNNKILGYPLDSLWWTVFRQMAWEGYDRSDIIYCSIVLWSIESQTHCIETMNSECLLLYYNPCKDSKKVNLVGH